MASENPTIAAHPLGPWLRMLLGVCLMTCGIQDASAHRIQPYEKWPLAELCQQALAGDPEQRELYITELGTRFRGEDAATATLLTIIRNPKEESQLRGLACGNLDLTSDKGRQHIPLLIALIESEKDDFFRLDVLRALTSQCKGDQRVIGLCMGLARDRAQGSILRRHAVYLIGKDLIGAPESLGLLQKILGERNEDPNVRYNAAAGLVREHLDTNGVFPQLQGILQDRSEDPFVRGQIAWCFGVFCGGRSKLHDPLHQLATDNANPQELRDAATAILATRFERDPRGMPLAIEMLADSRRSPMARSEVMGYLQKKGPIWARPCLPILHKIAGDRNDNDQARQAAMACLHTADETSESYRTIRALCLDRTDSSSARCAALQRLGEQLKHGSDALDVARTLALRHGDDIKVRTTAMNLLGWRAKEIPEIAELFEKLISDPNEQEELRANAAFHLATRFSQQMDDRRLMDQALHDRHSAVRREAVRGWVIKHAIVDDPHRLLLEDSCSTQVYIDPTIPINEERVAFLSSRLNRPEMQLKSDYEELAGQLPLQLEWEK